MDDPLGPFRFVGEVIDIKRFTKQKLQPIQPSDTIHRRFDTVEEFAEHIQALAKENGFNIIVMKTSTVYMWLTILGVIFFCLTCDVNRTHRFLAQN